VRCLIARFVRASLNVERAMSKTVFVAFAIAVADAAVAQPRRADPADPAVKGPPPQYRSVFEDYRPFTEPEVADWRKVNQEVAEAGGHKGHAPSQPKGEQAAPASKAHEGHK
jgi:hypothetical protein